MLCALLSRVCPLIYTGCCAVGSSGTGKGVGITLNHTI
ncbi:hypothetical protein GBAR_LOCUS15116 [Geodia barretti]|uniref:Uncharacterized protein n=1 Tax=Geodia barretti TaxID=519541 RepID=A0AA35SA67_GEOBA|nr:hypothetical protein GBAR_LOCUS15116 [Geodia barretti]